MNGASEHFMLQYKIRNELHICLGQMKRPVVYGFRKEQTRKNPHVMRAHTIFLPFCHVPYSPRLTVEHNL